MAAYRLSGTRRLSLAVLLTLEVFLIAGVFISSGALAATALTSTYISRLEVLLWILSGGATWILVAAIGIIRSVVVGAATLTRER